MEQNVHTKNIDCMTRERNYCLAVIIESGFDPATIAYYRKRADELDASIRFEKHMLMMECA